MRASSLALLLLALAGAGPSQGFEYYVKEGLGVQLHGAAELRMATISSGFQGDHWFLSEFTPRLNMEFEFDLAPDGIGFINYMSAFARVDVRFKCVFKNVCGMWRGFDRWGDDADVAAPNLTDGTTSGFTGSQPNSTGQVRLHDDRGTLIGARGIFPLRELLEIGNELTQGFVDRTFAPVDDALFAARRFNIDKPYGPGNLPQGPWNTGYFLRANGALQSVDSPTNPARDRTVPFSEDPGGLVARPKVDSLYSPSAALIERMPGFDAFDQAFTENQMFFDHGASQDEGELKELYFDFEFFDSRLWVRAGKQMIVWGKTELFRTTDQLNPVDIAVGSLPSLEESRIAQWSLRGVWSFYNVGPIEDLRVELAWLMDDFEPVDLGFCGEPYTPWLVCGKSTGLFFHGFSGIGLAGEERPPNWWEDLSGNEIGGRVEFRWNRFSFAITDFYGYDRFPHVYRFNGYERAVDPSGRPLDVNGDRLIDAILETGDPLLTDQELLDMGMHDQWIARRKTRKRSGSEGHLGTPTQHPGNRGLFDIVCSVTVGLAAGALGGDDPTGGIVDDCLLDLLNDVEPLLLMVSPANALTMVMSGTVSGQIVINALTGALVPLVPLNRDPDDGPLPVLGSLGCTTFEGGLGCLSAYLTDQQEALLGCGPFYGNSCDKHGVDLFNAEFSVIVQRFHNVEPEMAVGTRREFGNHFVLPGARGPDSLLYDPRLDGCVNAVDDGAAPAGYCAGAANDLLGAGFRSELAAVSENFVILLAALGAAGTDDDGEPSDPDCSIAEPGKCTLVTAVAAISGVQRPEISALGNGRFGRRDFLWHSGGEAVLRYDKRNVLGFSMDMAEDRTGTNWGIEFTWIDDQVFSSNVTENNITEKDVFNLTISVDRITLIRFLNRNRSFFINSQWFFRWIKDYPGDREMTPNGPLTVLGTLAISTGYWQDRLIPSLVLVHDFMSASGGGFFQTSYRFSEVFSVTLGLAYFYGEPRRTRTGNFPLLNSSNRPPYLARTDYQGLSVISEREEIFMRIRYTF